MYTFIHIYTYILRWIGSSFPSNVLYLRMWLKYDSRIDEISVLSRSKTSNDLKIRSVCQSRLLNETKTKLPLSAQLTWLLEFPRYSHQFSFCRALELALRTLGLFFLCVSGIWRLCFKVTPLVGLRVCKASLFWALTLIFPGLGLLSEISSRNSTLLGYFLSTQCYPEMPVAVGIPQVLVNAGIGFIPLCFAFICAGA